MDFGPLFPGMVNTAGALLPALISLGLVMAGRVRSRLSKGDQFWLGVFSLALSVVLTRVTITPDAISLHMLPGATLVVCYLVWRGYYIFPGLAFALTYATSLPVDVCLAQLVTGSQFNTECIGGGGWHDGLLIFPALTALAVGYANWRMARVGRAGLFWFGQRTGGHAPEPAPDNLDRAMVAGS
ncbi:MAG: hypothetical protein WBX11_09505 [Thiobacillaceae bacterium]